MSQASRPPSPDAPAGRSVFGATTLDRRSFLRAAFVTTAGAALAARRGFAAPALVQAELTPEQFGATGGDAVKDTAGWNAAIAEAAANGRPVLARGTYVLRAPAESSWNWWRRPAARVHVAVQLRSGVRIQGDNAVFLIGKPESEQPERDERHILFGTGENVEQGTLRDVTLDGLTFDFRDEFGPIHGFTYAVGVTGMDNLQRNNIVIRSSGARAGRGLLAENTRGRRDTNIQHSNIVQGIYARYEHDVAMSKIDFDGFNEALDFDGPCWDVALRDLSFANAKSESQCIDTAGGSNWLIENVVARNTGQILDIYGKANSWPTYGEWLDKGDTTEMCYLAPSDWVVRNIQGVGAGRPRRKGEAIRIGVFRNKHWWKNHGRDASIPSPKNITLEHCTLDKGTQIVVNDCENLKVSDVSMTGSWCPDDPELGAALVLRESDPKFGGSIGGVVSDVEIIDPQRMGVSVVAGPKLSLRNITVRRAGATAKAVRYASVRVRARPGTSATATLETSTFDADTARSVDTAGP